MLMVVAVIQVKVAETSPVVRHLYIKEHNVTNAHSCKPNERTLLVLNVPPYVTEVRPALPVTSQVKVVAALFDFCFFQFILLVEFSFMNAPFCCVFFRCFLDSLFQMILFVDN